jgi:hypothetical protein
MLKNTLIFLALCFFFLSCSQQEIYLINNEVEIQAKIYDGGMTTARILKVNCIDLKSNAEFEGRIEGAGDIKGISKIDDNRYRIYFIDWKQRVVDIDLDVQKIYYYKITPQSTDNSKNRTSYQDDVLFKIDK